ncbi:MAG: diphosphomevalonate decarboxylase [Saprospiraceae bacterium]
MKNINGELILDKNHNVQGKVGWKSPSNIALVKYWGKYKNQIPINPSISFTLSQAYTQTIIEYSSKKKDDNKISFDFYFEGKQKPEFARRITSYLNSLLEIFPFLTQLHFEIFSDNSFPHSSGIASSASSMSSLALCLNSIERNLFEVNLDYDHFTKRSSYVARLGSGSACRSIFPKIALWGKMEEIPESSDEYGIPLQHILHPNFQNYHDDILIVSKKAKSISSSDGHKIMSQHQFKDGRIKQVNKRLYFLLRALQSGDYEKFGEILENEALTLHSMMLSSEPAYILLEPNTLKIIQMVESFRNSTKLPVYFSLDAGPNVHLLYPGEIADKVQDFINNDLVKYCKDGDYIKDYLGTGPKEIDFV